MTMENVNKRLFTVNLFGCGNNSNYPLFVYSNCSFYLTKSSGEINFTDANGNIHITNLKYEIVEEKYK